MKPLLVTIRQATELLGIGKSKVYELCAARELDRRKVHGCSRITMESIEALIERSRVHVADLRGDDA